MTPDQKAELRATKATLLELFNSNTIQDAGLAITAGIIALGAFGLPLRLGLVVATLIGIGVGISIEMGKRRRAVLPGEVSNIPLVPTNEVCEISSEKPGGEEGV